MKSQNHELPYLPSQPQSVVQSHPCSRPTPSRRRETPPSEFQEVDSVVITTASKALARTSKITAGPT